MELALRGVAQGTVEVFQLHQFQIRATRLRERDAVIAVGGGIGERVRPRLVRVVPGLVVPRIKGRPTVAVVRALERPCLRSARLVALPRAAVDFVQIDLLRRVRAEIVRHRKRKLCGRGDGAVLGIDNARIVVVEQVGARGVAGEAARLRRPCHALSVRIGRGEVPQAGGDRAVSGEAADGEAVPVEVERLVGRHGDRPEHLVAEEREVVVEGLVDQRVGKRAGAVAHCFEPLARGAAVAYRVVEADDAAGVLRGNEVELQVARRVIDLERVEEVGRVVAVGCCSA